MIGSRLPAPIVYWLTGILCQSGIRCWPAVALPCIRQVNLYVAKWFTRSRLVSGLIT